jgi:hypothetical protein
MQNGEQSISEGKGQKTFCSKAGFVESTAQLKATGDGRGATGTKAGCKDADKVGDVISRGIAVEGNVGEICANQNKFARGIFAGSDMGRGTTGRIEFSPMDCKTNDRNNLVTRTRMIGRMFVMSPTENI